MLLDHREISKLKSTYTDKLPKMVNPRTGRVHTTYAQAVAVTGRLSSNDPNLQNIPVRTPEGRRIREAFVAPRRARHRQRRLLAGGAAHHGAHLGRREPPARLRGGRGHPPRHRRRGLRPLARRGLLRGAPLRQGDQLRADLRHVGVRPGAAARPRARHRAGLHLELLHALSRGGEVHGGHAEARARPGLRRDRARPAAVASRRSRAPTRRGAAAPSAPRSTRRCRARRRT